MPIKDGFDPGPLPRFLTREPEEQDIGKARDGAVIWPRLLMATALVATATTVTIAILSPGNPLALFADVTASVVDNSAVKPGIESMPTVQSNADAKASLRPTGKDAPSRDELAAASESAGQNQPESSAPSSEALFTEFQAQAAERAQAQVAPIQQPVQQQPVQHAPAKAAESARPTEKHRHVKPVHHAQAEVRPAQNPQKKARREQNAQVEVPPAQDAPAQDQSMQNPFLQIFGWRN